MGCEECEDMSRGPQGDPGVSSIVYLGYASDANGTNFSLIPDDSLKFISIIIKQTPAINLAVADFPKPFLRYLGDGRGYDATSTSTLTIGLGSQTLTIDKNKAYLPGSRVRVASSASPTTKWMEGVVTAYDPATGIMTFIADLIGVVDTLSAWDISIAGQPGKSIVIYSNVSSIAILSGAKSTSQVMDTFSLPAGTLAVNGDFIEVECMLRSNNGTVPVVVDISINGVSVGQFVFVPITNINRMKAYAKIIRYDATDLSFNIEVANFIPSSIGVFSAHNQPLGGNFSNAQNVVITVIRTYGATTLNDFYVEDITIKQYVQ